MARGVLKCAAAWYVSAVLATQHHHAIDYLELGVTDLAAAKRFYTAAFGWAFTDYGPEYAGIRRADGQGEVGGLAQVPSVTRGGALLVLYSKDLRASALAIERAGGHIVKPAFSFPGGWRFHFTDPSGNELAVWSEREGG
jgi:uncharacterized protein